MLGSDNVFSYEYVLAHRTELPECVRDKTRYYLRCANGFLKLHTMKGMSYWCAQTLKNNRPADWKIHFSIHSDDVPKAWNILAELFMEEQCQFSMKAMFQEDWPKYMFGREITVYIFRYDESYSGTSYVADEEDESFSEQDEMDGDFWFDFIDKAEKSLSSSGIRSASLAKGDYSLSEYASLRNEAYVLRKSPGLISKLFCCTSEMEDSARYIYPPNSYGFNAAGHPLPFELELRKLMGNSYNAPLTPLSL